MEDYERLAEWIKGEMKKIDKQELLAQREPRKHVRLSIREVARRMGIDHAPLVRAMTGKGGHHNITLLKQLAAFFGAPEDVVFRVAGVLPPLDPADELDAKVMDALRKLKNPKDKQAALRLIRSLSEEEPENNNKLVPVA